MRLFRPFLALIALATACGAFAAEAVAKGPVVWVNGIAVARFSVSVGQTSPSGRAVLAASRLNAAAAAWAKGPYVIVDGTPAFSVAAGDAKAAKSTPAGLAAVWAKKLNAALQIPALSVSDEFVRLPTGGQRLLKISGIEAKSAQVKVDDVNVALVQRTGNVLVIRGKSVGRTVITVQGASAMETIDVDIKPLAAEIPKTMTVEVTGAPTVGSIVRGAIEGGLRTTLTGLPGVKFTYGPINSRSVESGASIVVPVRINATAPDAFNASSVVSVRVKNVPVSRLHDANLWYSNNPESVKQPGPLFAANLTKGSAARLLYHHMNAMPGMMFLRVQAINESDQPARVALMPGDSTPDRNPVRAGLRAADQYIKGFVTGSAEIVTIPPKSTLPICLRRLAPFETGSGLCTLRLLDGPDELLVRTDAFPPFTLDERWTAALFSSTPWHEVGTNGITEYDRAPTQVSLHIYPDPYKTEEVSYSVGGRYGFVRLGQRPIQRQDASGGLDGNFGVMYSIKAKLENPTANATEIEIVFEASAGYASGLFVVNGRTVTIPQLSPKTEGQVVKVRLAPGQTQTLDITTLPISGSAYPATLTIRPVVNEGNK